VSFQKVCNWMVHGFCVAFYFLIRCLPWCRSVFSICFPYVSSHSFSAYFISLCFFVDAVLFYFIIFMFGPLYLLHVSSRLLYHSPPAHIYPLCFFSPTLPQSLLERKRSNYPAIIWYAFWHISYIHIAP